MMEMKSLVVAMHSKTPSLAFAATNGGGVFYRQFNIDLNLDDVLDINDLFVATSVIAAKNPYQADLATGDLNEDGKLDAVDLVLMMVELEQPD
jgi:hypothetical protein